MPSRTTQSASARQRVIRLTRESVAVRPKDLVAIGVPREYLKRLREEGVLEQPARGIYVLANAKPTEHQTLVEVCKRVPHGVVCLLSALQFHRLTTQIPHEVWLAIGSKTWPPKLEYPPLRLVRFSSATLGYAVEEHRVAGAVVRVYSPAKTVADCFKFRNKIGLDVALEALRDCLKKRRATIDDLWKAAKVCRVANVMRPYLESLA
jgi:predicted transcriptional regulator of viral defense system